MVTFYDKLDMKYTLDLKNSKLIQNILPFKILVSIIEVSNHPINYWIKRLNNN